MSQILHIFRKDTRRFWPEILAFLVALSLYAFLYPSRWNYSLAAMRSQYLNVLLPVVLVPATCWLLIARVIHAESLVGDRQWWLTRPYEWKKLLAAKALFIAVWVYAPFVAAEAGILKEGGLSPLAHFAGWFPLLAIASAYGVLPLVAIATVTANFARMTLTLFGAAVAWVALVYVTTAPRGGYESTVPYDHNMWIVVVVAVGAAVAVLLQYAIRRVWLGRAVAIGTVVLATGVGIALMATREGEINRLYPVSSAAPIALSQSTAKTVHVLPSERPGMAYIQVPVDFSGVAEGSAVELDDVKIAVDSPSSGWRWTAPWWSSQTQRILPGTHHGEVEIMMSRDQLKRFVQGSATMQLTLATTELHAASDVTAAISAGDFPVDGIGVCTGRWMYRFRQTVFCRTSALGTPPLTHVSATWYPKACSDEEKMPNLPLTAATWSEMRYPGPLVDRLLPVQPAMLNLNPDWHDGYDLYRTVGLALCPGTVVHFTQYAVTRRTQVSLTLPNSYFQTPQIGKVLNDPRGEQ